MGLEFGAVYHVPGEEIVLPTHVDRGTEKVRRVVVLQSTIVCARQDIATVLVAPASTTEPGGPFDHQNDGLENGFTVDDVVIFTSLIQPILKKDLGKRIAVVGKQCQADLRNHVLRLIGCL